jgi:hypothetical protein
MEGQWFYSGSIQIVPEIMQWLVATWTEQCWCGFKSNSKKNHDTKIRLLISEIIAVLKLSP